MLLSYIKANVAPVLVDFISGKDINGAVVLPANIDVKELNDHYEELEFVSPKWFNDITNTNEIKLLVIDKIELEDISQIHKVRSHIEYSELCDETLNKRMINHNPGVDSIVEEQIIAEEIREAISKLSETQKRRIKM